MSQLLAAGKWLTEIRILLTPETTQGGVTLRRVQPITECLMWHVQRERLSTELIG